MIYFNIYSGTLTHEEKDFLLNVISYIGVPKGMIKFWNVNEHTPISSSLINLCIDNSHTIFGRKLIEDKVYPPRSLLSGNVIDPDRKFILISVPMSVSEIKATESNKDYFWESLKNMEKYLLDYGYIGQDKVVDPIEVDDLPKDPIEEELDIEVKKDTVMSPAVEEPKEEEVVKTESAPIYEKLDPDVISIEVESLIDKFIEEIKASDQTLGKSLKLTNRVSITNKDGSILNIYPNNMIKSGDPGAHISWKDMISIIKMSIIVGSKNINLHMNKEN